jgi:hypothetical protein
LGKFFGHEGSNADVLQAYRIDHPAGRLTHPGSGRSSHRLDRKPLYDDSSQAVQVNKVGKLQPVAKSAAGSNYGVFQTNSSDANSEVNPRGRFGSACRLWRAHGAQSSTLVKPPAEDGTNTVGAPSEP